MKTGTLDSHLKVWGLEGDFAVLQDGSMVFGLVLDARDIESAANESVNQLVQQMGSFLNSLPVGTSLQFVQDVRGGNGEVLDKYLELGEDAKNQTSLKLAAQRIEKFRALDEAECLPRVRSYLFVKRPLSQALIAKRGFFSKTEKFPRLAEDAFSREALAADALRQQVMAELSALGLSPRPLPGEKVARITYEQWNPDRKVPLRNFDGEDLRSSLVLSDVEVTNRGFRIGETHHRVISLKIMPEQTVAGLAAAFSSLPFGARLFLSVHVPDQQKEIESLQGSRRLAYSMAAGKKAGVSDLESEAKLRDIETLLEEMISAGERVFKVSLNILLTDRDAEPLSDKVAQVLSVLRSLSGAEGMEESIAAFRVFSELSIPNVSATERARRMKTSNLADLVPVFAPWRGHSKPSILLRNRRGSLLSFDPHDVGLANGNMLFSGASGSGKSYLTTILLSQMLRENAKVYFVDVGGSYKKLCDNLEGQYVPLGVSNGISFNPFDLQPEETAPTPEKIKFLLSLVELMTREEGSAHLPRLDRAEIEDAIARVYEKTAKPRLSDLRALLLENQSVEIRRYGRILGAWCGDTPFGRFIDRETTIALSKPLVAFDLKGIESYPDLQTVCLFIITDFVWREVQRDRATPKFLVFDECWTLLKDDRNETALSLLENVYRVGRKYRLSTASISQAVSDFVNSKVASAILSNCSVKWLLSQGQIDFAQLKEVLSLNENEIELIKSLRQDKGKFSEAFLIAQDARAVAVIEATPLEYWIATTDPRDLAAIEADEREHVGDSGMNRLVRLSERYPNGVAAHNQAELETRRAA